MRTIPALLVTIGLAAALSGCAASGAGSTPSSCATPGAASQAVTATGAFGKEPKVSVPKGLKVQGTQVSVLRQGDGREVEDGTPVLIEYTLVDGTTGSVAQTSGYSGQTPPITAGASNYGALGASLQCAHVGDRLAVALPQSALNAQGTDADSTSGRTEDAVVAVIDVKRAYDARATGVPQLAGDRMPAVVLAPDGAPGITIPSWKAPTADETHLLRKGSGATFGAEDTALIKYTAVTWGSDSGEDTVAGSTWTDGAGAQTVPLGDGQVPDSIRKAILGHRVGDQVLAIIHEQGSAYAYVIDLLGKVPA